VDRWNVFRGAFAAGGVIGQGTNLTTGDLPFNDAGIKTFARVGRLSGNSVAGFMGFQYNMESQDCYRFVGKKVTVSFYYRTGANFSSTSIDLRVYTGTGTDQALRNGFTGSSFPGYSSNNQNTAWQRISLTFTLGTNINQIGLDFACTFAGTAGAADYFDITGVQLELGSVATPFEVRPYPVELQMCMRYCQGYSRQIGVGIPGPLILIQITPFVQFRSTPIFSLKSTTIYFESTPWSAVGTITNAAILDGHMTQFGGDIAISATFSPALVNNYPYLVGDVGPPYLIASSEL